MTKKSETTLPAKGSTASSQRDCMLFGAMMLLLKLQQAARYFGEVLSCRPSVRRVSLFFSRLDWRVTQACMQSPEMATCSPQTELEGDCGPGAPWTAPSLAPGTAPPQCYQAPLHRRVGGRKTTSHSRWNTSVPVACGHGQWLWLRC